MIKQNTLTLGVRTDMEEVLEVLKDSQGRLLGKISKRNDGRHELRDHTGRTLGIYDPKLNRTVDRTGRDVGRGNLLAMLLKSR